MTDGEAAALLGSDSERAGNDGRDGWVRKAFI